MFQLSTLLRELVGETRRRPQIPLVDILRCVLWLYGCRLPSLNALEEVLQGQGRALVEKRVPSADTIGRMMARTDPEGIRKLLARVCARGRRSKAIRHRAERQPWCVSVDGHELFWSWQRHCAGCLTREIQTRQGPKLQYYHTEVTVQLVDAEPPMCLDAELVAPGEGEIGAARRLLRRVLAEFAFIQVVSLDGLYLEAPILREILAAGKGAIVVLKEERRELYREARALMSQLAPQEALVGGDKVEFWELGGLRCWEALEGVEVRVVRTRRYRTRPREGQAPVQDWMWAVVGLGPQVSALSIHRLGHARWDIENCGFNEQDRFFGLDHCFKHHPRAILNFILLLFLGTLLTELFFTRNLKPQRRRGMSLSGLARCLLQQLPRASEASVWTTTRGP